MFGESEQMSPTPPRHHPVLYQSAKDSHLQLLWGLCVEGLLVLVSYHGNYLVELGAQC